MKAVLCKAFGAAEDLSLEDVDEPSVKPGHVVVEVKASAVNFPDVLMIEGKYHLTRLSVLARRRILWWSRSGQDVEQWQVGDEVFASLGHGCFAEKVLGAAHAR